MLAFAFLLVCSICIVPGVGRVLKADSTDHEVVQQLTEATRGLQELCRKWESLTVVTSSDSEVMKIRAKYVQKDAELRASVQRCPFGDPAETSTVSRHQSGDAVARAHGETTRAIFEAKLAHQEWEIRCMEAAQRKSGSTAINPQIGSALVALAEIKLRLFDLDEAYEYLQRAAVLGSPDTRLTLLNRYCAQLKAPRSNDFMTGVDFSAGSQGEQLLQGIKSAFLKANYYRDNVLRVTSTNTMSHFIYLTRADQIETQLKSAKNSQILVDLIRIFLLHRVVPLSRIRSLLGPEALKLLLSLQAVSAIEGSAFSLVPHSKALAVVQDDPHGCGGLQAFSNIEIWPVEDDLIIATDFQETYSTEDLEPVMYISEDSLALVNAAPRAPAVKRLLDVCTGSGVQGIVGLRYYAETCTFVDLNPRALKFTAFNLAMNGFADRALGFYEGSGYDALPSDIAPFDAIVANPPFVPNPDGVASGAGAMFGNGGTTGENVMAILVSGAHRMLKPGGRLSTVSVAPNVEEFPARIQEWFSSEASSTGGCEGYVFRGQPKTAKEYAPGGGAPMETIRYERALKDLGIRTLSDVLMVLRVGGESSFVSLEGVPRHDLWEDYAFLRTVVQKALPMEPLEANFQATPPEQPATSASGNSDFQSTPPEPVFSATTGASASIDDLREMLRPHAASQPVAQDAEAEATAMRRRDLESKMSDMLRYLELASEVGYKIPGSIRQGVQDKVQETREWSQTSSSSEDFDAKSLELDIFMDEAVRIIHENLG